MNPSTAPKTMKFGFIAHPTSVALKRHVKIVDLLERTIAEQDRGYRDDRWQWRNLVPFADFGRIVSAQGAVCEGILHYMPLTAEEMLSQPRAIAQRVVDAVESLKDQGAQVVGLGGFTAIVGNRGLQTLERTGIPVTTGNSLTAYAAYRNVLESMDRLGVEPADTEVAVVGYPGSIALVIAKLLAGHGCRLCLVHRGSEAQGRQGLAYLPESMHAQVRLSNDIEHCYEHVQFYVAATSTGGLIDPYRLRPGSVVVDAALPRDVKPYHKDRNDILIIDGGLVSASSALRFGAESMGLAPKKFLNGCLAETLILGLEGRAEAFSIGRELPEDKVLEIGRIAELHGFSPSRWRLTASPWRIAISQRCGPSIARAPSRRPAWKANRCASTRCAASANTSTRSSAISMRSTISNGSSSMVAAAPSPTSTARHSSTSSPAMAA